jgi:hypothetical protein
MAQQGQGQGQGQDKGKQQYVVTTTFTDDKGRQWQAGTTFTGDEGAVKRALAAGHIKANPAEPKAEDAE